MPARLAQALRRTAGRALLLLGLLGVAATAIAKDELVIGMTQYPSNWNPHIDAMLAKSVVLAMTNRPLTVFDAEWNLICMLCTELPTLENGKAVIEEYAPDKKGIAVTFTLKKLVWGDGTPVTTKDVLFTIEVGRHPQTGITAQEDFRRIRKVTVADEQTFTLHMDRIQFDYNALGMPLLPAHIEQAAFADPANYRVRSKYETETANPGLWSGPYRITETTPGAQIVLERNPTWTGAQPFFRRIVFRIIENSAALEANLLSGSVDYVLGELGLAFDQAAAFEKRHRDRFNVVYKPGLVYEHIDVKLENPLLADKRVRQALMWALDRESISQKLFEGKQPVAHSNINPLDPMFNAQAPQYRYEPAKARALLDEAGFKDIRNGIRHNAEGQKLSIDFVTTGGNRTREQIQQVLQSQWRQIGVEVRLRNEPPRVMFSESMTKRNFSGLAMYAWVSAPQSVPRGTLHSKEIPSAANGWIGQNYPGYRNPEMDRVLEAAEQELDADKRKALMAEEQRLYAEELPVLPMFYRTDVFILPKQLKGVVPTGHQNASTLWIEQWRWEP